MVYNVKVFRYLYGSQIRFYHQGIVLQDEQIEECKTGNNLLSDNDVEECDDQKVASDCERSAYNSKSRSIQNIYEIARSNMWDFFITLTFNPELVDSFNYDDCVKKLSKWLNNLRRIAPDLVYIVVPEKHKSGRYHFHGLFANCGNIEFVDSGKRSGNSVIYNIGSYKLGFSTATLIKDMQRVSSYITKYITKELCAATVGKKRYWASRNCARPVVEKLQVDCYDFDDFIASQNVTFSKTITNKESGVIINIYEIQ